MSKNLVIRKMGLHLFQLNETENTKCLPKSHHKKRNAGNAKRLFMAAQDQNTVRMFVGQPLPGKEEKKSIKPNKIRMKNQDNISTEEKLARLFAEKIRKEVTPEQLIETNKANKENENGACHSHNFCNSAKLMNESYEELLKGQKFYSEVDVTNKKCSKDHFDAQMEFVNKAWMIAMQNDFYVTEVAAPVINDENTAENESETVTKENTAAQNPSTDAESKEQVETVEPEEKLKDVTIEKAKQIVAGILKVTGQDYSTKLERLTPGVELDEFINDIIKTHIVQISEHSI